MVYTVSGRKLGGFHSWITGKNVPQSRLTVVFCYNRNEGKLSSGYVNSHCLRSTDESVYLVNNTVLRLLGCGLIGDTNERIIYRRREIPHMANNTTPCRMSTSVPNVIVIVLPLNCTSFKQPTENGVILFFSYTP